MELKMVEAIVFQLHHFYSKYHAMEILLTHSYDYLSCVIEQCFIFKTFFLVLQINRTQKSSSYNTREKYAKYGIIYFLQNVNARKR